MPRQAGPVRHAGDRPGKVHCPKAGSASLQLRGNGSRRRWLGPPVCSPPSGDLDLSE